MSRSEKHFKEKKFGICIGPVGEDPNEILQKTLKLSKQTNDGRDIDINDVKVSPDNLFVVFTVRSFKESQAVIEQNVVNLCVTPVDINTYEKSRETIQTNFSNMIHDSKTLNLSCLPELGIGCNLCIPLNTSFVLFYSALLCRQEGINIRKLVYKENKIKDLKGFYPITAYFPNLKKIIIPTDVEVKDFFKENYEIIQDDSNEYCLAQENYWDKIGFPIISAPNTFLTDPELTERSSHIELQMYQPIKLNPSFKGNPLIIDFYKCAWHDIESLLPFYVDDSVFSITVNYHSPNSPLCYYDKFSRNMLYTNNINNYIVGSENIISAQKELFGNHFYAYVTAVNEIILLPQYISVIAHGVFQLNDDVMGFDRSMNIAFDDNNTAIINDHIFFRNPEKIE